MTSDNNGCCNNPICQGYGKPFGQPPTVAALNALIAKLQEIDSDWTDTDLANASYRVRIRWALEAAVRSSVPTEAACEHLSGKAVTVWECLTCGELQPTEGSDDE